MKDLESQVVELPPFKVPYGIRFRDQNHYENLRYKVRFDLNIPEEKFTEFWPASNCVEKDSWEKTKSIVIKLWEGIPDKFKPTVFYHELKEAEFRYTSKLPKSEAHQKAVKYHEAYAKKFLSEEDFEEFNEWLESCRSKR